MTTAETTGGNARPRFARPELRKALLLAAIAAVIAVALLNRTYFLVYRGGLALDQQAWAAQYYFGGITKHYLQMRDAILAWTAEPKPWSYLPGYPLLLAFLHFVGIKDLSLVRLAQVVIDSLAILPLYFVLLRLGKSAYLAVFGCLIYAAAPWWSVGSTYLLADSLLPALVILLLAAMVLVRDHAERAANWFLLGLLAAVLPFFRSEMVLLFGPLAIWALLVAPKRKRLSSAACVVAGFATPLLLWALRNYYVHGQFMLTPPAKWYAAWAGLGQIESDYGYFVSDARAIKLLASKGIGYHSLEAEKYWFGQYIAAWINHPGHVIRTILYRFEIIVGGPETLGTFVRRPVLLAYGAAALMTPIVLIWLLYMRRLADAFLVALPIAYALGSLGILYVEKRYVGYAGLSYLLALIALFAALGDVCRALWSRQWGAGEPRRLFAAVGVVGFVVLGAAAAFQLVLMRDVAHGQGLIDRLNVDVALQPTSDFKDILFRPVVPSVEISRGEAGLELRANAPIGHYLLAAPTGARKNGGMIVRYRAILKNNAIGLGVLSANSEKWLSHRTLASEAPEPIEGAFASLVEAGSQFVIDAAGAKPGTDVLISRLEWALVCPEPVNLLHSFLNRRPVEPRACS